ncbi:MAG TPA: methyltransferase [Flavisolibacter sp.]
MKVTTDSCLFGAWCAAEIAGQNMSGPLLDIGTGTGLLSLMIAQKNKVAIDAVEIDADAAAQAAENVRSATFDCSVQVTSSDIALFRSKNYKAVVCNPPFYEGDLEAPAAIKNTAHHSSHLKWKDLFPIICDKLQEEGSFYLLLPFKRAKEAQHLLAATGLFAQRMVLVKPSVNHEPFRVMIRGSKKEVGTEISELSVRDNNQEYTTAVSALLKDYYLYL